ncbi:MAG: DUF3656 domain-containing protein, partial [Verrucomicrobiota bacterium]
MTFSRGLYSGWMHGVNHQELVGARFGKKRGAFVGRVESIGRFDVGLDDVGAELKAGDGVVFDTGGDTNNEQGGRVFEIRGRRIFFEHGKIDFRDIPVGSRVWKTSDPALDRELRASFSGRIEAREGRLIPLDFVVEGRAGSPLKLMAKGCEVVSRIPLEEARTRPLTEETLRAQLGKLGGTGFFLRHLESRLEGSALLPLSELNRLRRELIDRLSTDTRDTSPKCSLENILPTFEKCPPGPSRLSVLIRSEDQLAAALDEG